MNCKQIDVPRDCCYVAFWRNGKTAYSASSVSDLNLKKGQEFPFETVRGEMVIIDFDKKGRIRGLELIGNPKIIKPCQGCDLKSLKRSE